MQGLEHASPTPVFGLSQKGGATSPIAAMMQVTKNRHQHKHQRTSTSQGSIPTATNERTYNGNKTSITGVSFAESAFNASS